VLFFRDDNADHSFLLRTPRRRQHAARRHFPRVTLRSSTRSGPTEYIFLPHSIFAKRFIQVPDMYELQHWGYDFSCSSSVDAMLAALNAAGLWQWRMGDSDIYGFYLKCRPKELAEVRVYECAQFWMGSSGSREGFWAELSSDAGSRAEIDQHFRHLLHGIRATSITET
jgi:hypothetical protein